MKYRLTSDHGKTATATPVKSLRGRPWVEVSYNDSRLHGYQFRIPQSFLEESGWEPVPEEEWLIEDYLDLLCVARENYTVTPSSAKVHLETLRRAAEEIRSLRAERAEPEETKKQRISIVERIPESTARWLVEQGWIPVEVVSDSSTIPPTLHFTLTKEIP